jgi:hypothetical protein
MDRQKIREHLKKAHPKRKIVEQSDEGVYAADSDATDVDVSGLSPKTWKKFGAASANKPSASTSASSNRRERFRPRKLTGAAPGPGTPAADGRRERPRRAAGKLTLERLVPEDAGADTDDAVDVIVDEEQGVIGESDSGPEED